jgi:hypothetical protein
VGPKGIEGKNEGKNKNVGEPCEYETEKQV